jgi:hypothetical protein
MVFGDLHIHSCYSNGYFKNFPPWVASAPKEILEKAKKVGLKVIAIADHDSLKGSQEAAKLASEFGIIVVPACEITSLDGHILAYGIKKEIPKKLKAEKTIDLIHKQGGLAVAAHPFRAHPPIFNRIGLYRLVFRLPFDGLEVANASQPFKANNITLKAIRNDGLKVAQVGGSDSHVLDFIGYGRTIFKTKIKTTEDVLQAIKNRQTEAEVVKYIPFWQKCLASFRDQFKFLLHPLNIL